MNKAMPVIQYLIFFVVLIFGFMLLTNMFSCSSFSFSSSDDDDDITLNDITILDTASMFTTRDAEDSYDESEAIYPDLTSDTINITQEGVYVFSGNMTGQIIVELADGEKAQLVFDNFNITCDDSAPLYVKSADKLFVTLVEDSKNTLTINSDYVDIDDNNIDGVIYSKGDITFNGSGTLNIVGNYGHGIVGKDDIVFMDGIYNIISENHGVVANDSIRINYAEFDITSGKDGMQADNDEDSTLGYVYIKDAKFKIDATADGITSTSTLLIEDGDFDISSGGGYDGVLNSITVGEGSGNTVMATDKLAYSMKGFKAEDIQIEDGYYYFYCYEDAMHANNTFVINGGVFDIWTGDDAVHCDKDLTINDGTITIFYGYEGIEGANITINGGTIYIEVLDDAVNVGSSQGVLTINGGYIELTCKGDGLDSNGDFVMTGGTVILDVNAIYTAGDYEFDISGDITYTGGELYDDSDNTLDPSSSSSSSSFPSFRR